MGQERLHESLVTCIDRVYVGNCNFVYLIHLLLVERKSQFSDGDSVTANQPIMTSITAIPEDRDLSKDEQSLVEWLLDHGTPDAIRYRAHLNKARVAARCYCGCASIDFGIDGVVPNRGEPISILSDYEWIDTDGRLFGTFVFSRCDLLAGLEVWSQDGLAPADYLPEISQLRPIGTASDGEIG